MPLLDGKYEIIREERSGPRQTLFEASAPDGTLLRIVWFEVPEELERSFETYRRGLKRLQKSGLAAVYDVVSRPGAHYVAWHPPQGPVLQSPEPDVVEALRQSGFTPEQADVRRVGRRSQVHGLAWADAGQFSPADAMVAGDGANGTGKRSNALPQVAVNNGLALGILLVAALILVGANWQRGRSMQVTVPELLGGQVMTVMEQLAQTGLRPEPSAVPSDDSVGTVVSLQPEAGTGLARGSSVQVGYAAPAGSSQPPVTVPDLTGLSWPDEADRTLAGNGLRAGSIAWLPSDLPEGTVIAQSTAAGETVAGDTTLGLLVSSGAPVATAELPDLAGLPLEEALELALAAGLNEAQLSINLIGDITQRPGTVLAQNPAPGQSFELDGAGLELDVVEGDPEMLPLPSFVGLTLERARSLAAGFNVTVTEVSDVNSPEGVISQDPPAGTWVDSGELHLTVNEPPRLIPQPNPNIDVWEPEERDLAYRWYIEPGIPSVIARVYAVSLTGQEMLVAQERVQGGEWVEGTFDDTSEPLVTFRLTLNGDPYGDPQQAR